MKRLPSARSHLATFSPARLQQGFTLIELLIVIAIIGIMAGLAVMGLRGLRNDLDFNATELEGQVKLIRSKAMTTTRAYRLVTAAGGRIEAEWSERCSDTTGWQKDNAIWMELSERVSLANTQNVNNNVIICFTSRGLASTNPILTLQNTEGDTAEVEIFIGGGVEVRR
jgi:type II secretion system protein H